jgi:hypothetical protein
MEPAVAISIVAVTVALLAAAVAAAALERSQRAMRHLSAAQAAAVALEAEASDVVTRVASLEERTRRADLRHAELEQRAFAVAEEVDGARVRLEQVEQQVHELGGAELPPPIPAGKPVPRLDDLRAVLRAQAATRDAEGDDADEGDD